MKEFCVEDAFRRLKPENCYFVISVDGNGKPNIMVACWAMKCSLDPPLFAVSLSKKGYTHDLINKSREFVVAVPNKKLEKELMFFGSIHENKVDKFHESGIKTKKAKFLKSPLLDDATFNFECSLEKEVDAGDHTIFIGKILAAHDGGRKKVLLNMKKLANGKRIFKEF